MLGIGRAAGTEAGRGRWRSRTVARLLRHGDAYARSRRTRQALPSAGLVARHVGRFPGRSQILESCLDAFDRRVGCAPPPEKVEPDRARSGRRRASKEMARSDSTASGCALADPVRLDRADAANLQSGCAARLRKPARRALARSQAKRLAMRASLLGALQIPDVADHDDGVLHLGGDDGEIVGIESGRA